MLHELADPFGVLDVGLAAGDVAHVMRVEQPALEPLFKRLEHGLPVHARWPPSRRASRRPRPASRQAPRARQASSGTSGSADPSDGDPGPARGQSPRPRRDARRDPRIAPRSHPSSAPFETPVDMSPGGHLPRMSLTYALAAAINGPTGPRATLSHGL